MRQKMVAGNWKMNRSLEEGIQLCSEVIHMAQDEVVYDVEIVLIPTFFHLTKLKALLGKSSIKLGAQNCHQSSSGAYTGEVSAPILKSCGVDCVLAGHSERRQYFNETDHLIHEKIKAIVSSGMKAIYCCGEPLEIRENGTHYDYVSKQIQDALFELDAASIRKVIIAYEPVWAIGTGKNATNEQAQDMHAHIRELIHNQFGEAISKEMIILYGGSVKPSNASGLFACPDVDGGLIGGASLVARDFVDIVKAAQTISV